jgi:hypothetical protein
VTCPPDKRMKQTPEEEAAGKSLWWPWHSQIWSHQSSGWACGLQFVFK